MKYKCHFSNQHQKLYHISKAQPNTFSYGHSNDDHCCPPAWVLLVGMQCHPSLKKTFDCSLFLRQQLGSTYMQRGVGISTSSWCTHFILVSSVGGPQRAKPHCLRPHFYTSNATNFPFLCCPISLKQSKTVLQQLHLKATLYRDTQFQNTNCSKIPFLSKNSFIWNSGLK